MRVRLIAVGTRMPAWVNDGVEDYRRRLRGDIQLHVEEVPLPKRDNAPVDVLMQKEAEALLKRLGTDPRTHGVALEVTGKRLSTEQMAERLRALRDQGDDLALLVGGPDGLAPAAVNACRESWSLSALTLPHPLVRLVVAEQVYRCWSVLQGHPYHRP